MNKLVLLVSLILAPILAVAGEVDTLVQCRPNFVLKKGYLDTESLATINASISAADFISQSEWDACKILAVLELARSNKKEEIKSEALRRARLIDPDFSLSNIGLYKKISVAALDADGIAIRSILIYAKQKITWLYTANAQDVNGYDPATDIGWP